MGMDSMDSVAYGSSEKAKKTGLSTLPCLVNLMPHLDVHPIHRKWHFFAHAVYDWGYAICKYM
jgi:hypothetical protein